MKKKRNRRKPFSSNSIVKGKRCIHYKQPQVLLLPWKIFLEFSPIPLLHLSTISVSTTQWGHRQTEESEHCPGGPSKNKNHTQLFKLNLQSIQLRDKHWKNQQPVFPTDIKYYLEGPQNYKQHFVSRALCVLLGLHFLCGSQELFFLPFKNMKTYS